MKESDRAEFRSFVMSTSDKTRVLELFDAYANNPEIGSKEFALLLYKSENTNALYNLRAKLSDLLVPFVVRKRNAEDIRMPDTANAHITYALIFLEHHQPECAVEPLEEAEKIATATRQYDTLMRLYEVKIKYSKQLGLKMKDLSMKWIELNNLRTMKSILTNSNAFLNEHIETLRNKGMEINEEELMEQFYYSKRHYVSDVRNPVLQYISLTAARTIYIASKNFQKIEALIRPIYEDILDAGAFAEADADIQSGLIYYMTHATYRNVNWPEALKWLDILQSRLPRLAAEKSLYYSKYILLAAAIATCTKQNALAIEILEDALHKKEAIPNKEDLVHMHLNLAVYYFQKGDYYTAEKTFDLIKAHYSVQVKKMGMEWRLKKDMIEMIIHYELGNDHVSRKLLKKMRSYYKPMLGQNIYKRADDFLGFIDDMIKDGTCVTEPAFHARVQEAKKGWENTEDDIQAIAFFCWLKSKMTERNYYEVLVERLQKPLRKLIHVKELS